MSEHGRSKCEERHDDLAAYALGALSAADAERLEEHVATCETCSERLLWLQPAVDLVPATVPQYAPPPELKASLMETVRAEAGVEPEESGFARWRGRMRETLFGGGSLRPALAGLAVVCLIVAGIAGYSLGGDDATSYDVVAQSSAKSSGSLTVEDGDAMLVVEGMTSLPADAVYQVWIEHDGRVLPSEIFVVDDTGHGSVAIESVPKETDRIMVTREPKGGSEEPGTAPVLIAELT